MNLIMIILTTDQGKEMCRKAYKKVMKVSHARLQSLFTTYKEGFTAKIKLRKERIPSEKQTVTLAWMRQKFSLIGDKMPHINQVRYLYVK